MDVTISSTDIDPAYAYNSFGNYHSDESYRGGKKPVSSSVTDLEVSSVSGKPVLYAGGTGTTGNFGGCARLARLTDNGWELIVDVNADNNTTGSNENGFGSPQDCSTNEYNFQAWSLEEFDGKLFAGIVGDGARVAFSPSGLSHDIKDDGSWQYSIGEGNVDPDDPSYVDPLGTSLYPNGFDGYQYSENPLGPRYQNIAANLFSTQDTLYAGIVVQYVPEFDIPPARRELKG